MNKLAFIFPGQGSQSLHMLQDLAQSHSIVEQTFQEASKVLGYDLWQLVQEGPEERLNQTEFTQPAILAASVAIWRVWCAAGGAQPVIMAGHSLGEYSALVCANALDFQTAIELVALRGRLMQEAVPEGQGAMAAIVGLADDEVRAVCDKAAAGDVVIPANYNAIGQVVIAGSTPAVERAVVLAKEAGAKIAKLLPVSVPSHCQLMEPAAHKLADALAKIKIHTPEIPVLHNVDVKTHTEAGAIRAVLVKQLYSPVRWVETVQHIAAQGINLSIECGPGKVLAGLCKRIVKELEVISIGESEALQKAL